MNPLLITVAHNTISISKKRKYRNLNNEEQELKNTILPANIAEDCTVKTIKDFKFNNFEDLNPAGITQVSVVKEGPVDAIIRLTKEFPEDSIGIR